MPVYDEVWNCTIEEYLRDNPDATFHIVIASEIMEHLTQEDAFAVMEKLKRRLAENGVLIVTVPNGKTPGGEGFDGNVLHKHQSGFDVADFETRGFATKIIPRLHISGRMPHLLGTAWHIIRRGKPAQGIIAVYRSASKEKVMK